MTTLNTLSAIVFCLFTLCECTPKTIESTDSILSEEPVSDSITSDTVIEHTDTQEDPSNEKVALGTMELCEFINPLLGAQIAKVVDTVFDRDDVNSVVLTLHPTATVYADMPGVDPEAGAPFNATLETYHSHYGGFASDSAFLGRMTACVKIGKLLCYVVTEKGASSVIRPLGKRHTVRHTFGEPEFVCICAEEDRRLLIGDDGSLQRVYSLFAFVPNGPIDSILVEYPDTYPEFPGGKEALCRFIAERIEWPEEIQRLSVVFTVELDGRVSAVEAPRNVREKSPEQLPVIEAIRPLLPSMPHWTPGKMQGKTVRTRAGFALRRP